MLGSRAGQYPGKGGSPLPQHRHSSARAWGQGRECLRAEPPSSSSQALSLPSLLVGAAPPANPALNMVHTRLPPLDPDLPAFPGELLRGERRSGIVASGLTGGQAAQPLLLLCQASSPTRPSPAPHQCLARGGWACPPPSWPAWNLRPKYLAGPKTLPKGPQALTAEPRIPG